MVMMMMIHGHVSVTEDETHNSRIKIISLMSQPQQQQHARESCEL